MDPNKLHERILEIQKNIENVPETEQAAMLSELLDITSKIEQSLTEIQIEDIDLDDLNINEESDNVSLLLSIDGIRNYIHQIT